MLIVGHPPPGNILCFGVLLSATMFRVWTCLYRSLCEDKVVQLTVLYMLSQSSSLKLKHLRRQEPCSKTELTWKLSLFPGSHQLFFQLFELFLCQKVINTQETTKHEKFQCKHFLIYRMYQEPVHIQRQLIQRLFQVLAGKALPLIFQE